MDVEVGNKAEVQAILAETKSILKDLLTVLRPEATEHPKP